MTEFYEQGEPVGSAAWADFAAAVKRALDAAPISALVAICGSFPVDVGPDAARSLASDVAARGCRLIIDTSGPHLAALLEARPFLVKVNAVEAASVLGGAIVSESDANDGARRLIAAGATRAIVTRGAEGAVGADPSGIWAVDAAPEAGPYAVGSGDAFLAGLAVSLTAGRPFEECLRQAAATAAASTLVIGQGELRAIDLERMREAVSVRRLP